MLRHAAPCLLEVLWRQSVPLELALQLPFRDAHSWIGLGQIKGFKGQEIDRLCQGGLLQVCFKRWCRLPCLLQIQSLVLVESGSWLLAFSRFDEPKHAKTKTPRFQVLKVHQVPTLQPYNPTVRWIQDRRWDVHLNGSHGSHGLEMKLDILGPSILSCPTVVLLQLFRLFTIDEIWKYMRIMMHWWVLVTFKVTFGDFLLSDPTHIQKKSFGLVASFWKPR